uniref:Peptidase S74 domain-containing protein n=1 Tax=viral metagenome TaxID=1070528 RepID=A0A6C0KN33_9ZZZZ
MKGHPEEERKPGEEEEEDFFKDYLGCLKQKTKDCIIKKIDEIITNSKLKFVNDIAILGVKIEEQELKFDDQQVEIDDLQVKIDNQQVKIDAQVVKIEEQMVNIAEQMVNIKEQGLKIDAQGLKIEEQMVNIAAQMGNIEEQRLKIDTQGLKIDAQGLKIEEHGVKIEEQGVKIADLDNTYIKEYFRATDPGKIKKTIDVNDSSIRVGLSTIADYDGNPSSFTNKNLLGNISLGNSCLGNLVAQDKIQLIKGKRNVSIGNGVLGFNESGDFNTGIGHNGMINNISGSANSAYGYAALSDNLVGINNTAIGSSALTYNFGSNNSALGRWAGKPLDGKTNLYWDWTTCLGSQTQATNSYQVVLGTDLQTVHQFFPSQIKSSDPRFQKNSEPCSLSLNFINKLKPIQFQTLNSNPIDKTSRTYLGLNAKDVKAALNSDKDSDKATDKDYALYTNEALRGGFVGETVSYEQLIPAMINAIQDLSKQVEEMKEVIEKFKGRKRFGFA